MKTLVKVLAALAAVAGVVYVIAAFGDKIVAWAKNLLGLNKADEDACCCDEADCEDIDLECKCAEAEEAAEAPAAEEAAEEAAETAEAPAEDDVQADETDFEG